MPCVREEGHCSAETAQGRKPHGGPGPSAGNGGLVSRTLVRSVAGTGPEQPAEEAGAGKGPAAWDPGLPARRAHMPALRSPHQAGVATGRPRPWTGREGQVASESRCARLSNNYSPKEKNSWDM